MLTNEPGPYDFGRSESASKSNPWPKGPTTRADQSSRPGKLSLSRVGKADFTGRQQSTDQTIGQPITDATDPRWVVAVRTASLLQGSILPPPAREKILKLGKMLNLSPFDTNLIIAIIQDQARRGYTPESCPTAGEQQLRLIAKSGDRTRFVTRSRRMIYIAMVLTATVAFELLVLWLMLP